MALIICPECNKEISDKSEKCIHCGHPINKAKIGKYVIDGKEYDLTFVLKDYLTKKDKIKKVQTVTNCSLKNAMNIVHKLYDEYNIIDEITLINENDNIPKCPYCNSKNLKRITTTAKAVNIAMFGLLGNKRKHQWHCNNCNSDF